MECELELESESESDMELGSDLDSGSFPSCNLSGHVPDGQRRTATARGNPSGHFPGYYPGHCPKQNGHFLELNGHFPG